MAGIPVSAERETRGCEFGSEIGVPCQEVRIDEEVAVGGVHRTWVPERCTKVDGLRPDEDEGIELVAQQYERVEQDPACRHVLGAGFRLVRHQTLTPSGALSSSSIRSSPTEAVRPAEESKSPTTRHGQT